MIRPGGDLLFIIDPHSGVPVYRQLVDQVRFGVAGGLLEAGEELPSTRTLSQELGVNPMTVSKAYGILEEEGLLTRRPGLPLVVRKRSRADSDRERARRLAALLEPAAVAARQLGIDEEEAAEIFRGVLSGTAARQEQAR